MKKLLLWLLLAASSTSVSFAATYGDTGTTQVGTATGFENIAINGVVFTSPGTEQIDTVTVRLRESSTTNAHTAKILLYRTSDMALIAESNARSDFVFHASDYSAYDFTFSSPPTLSNVSYTVRIYGNAAAGTLLLQGDATVGTDEFESGLTYPTAPNPGGVSGNITYTPRFVVTTSSTGSPAPTITDVDEDNIVTLEQTNVEVDGTNFDTATAEVRQGAEAYAVNIDSQDADTIVFDMPALSGAAPKHGAANFAVINDDDQEDEHAITVAADAGTDYVDLTSVIGGGVPRITAIPDLEASDQVQWGTVTGSGVFDETDVEVFADGSISWTEGVEAFEVRVWDHDDSTWSDWVEQTIDAAVAGAGGGAHIIRWRRNGRR